MMKRCLSSSYIFIGRPKKMYPVASDFSGVSAVTVGPDPITVSGFLSVTGVYLLGLDVFGVLRSSDGLARVIVGPAIAF